MGYDGGGDGFVDGAVKADDAFLFFDEKIVSRQARERGGDCRARISFYAARIEDVVCVFTIRSREKMSSVRFLLPHLSSSKLPKRGWGLFFFGARAFTCSPTASLAWSALSSKLWSRSMPATEKVLLRWARTTVSVTYGVGTHPRGGGRAPAEKCLPNNANLDALTIRREGDLNMFLSIQSLGRAVDRFRSIIAGKS